MTVVTRRTLFQMALVAPLLALLGKHDDTPRLQALIDAGRPIPPGSYDLRTTLHLRGRVHADGSAYRVHDGAVIHVHHMTGSFSHNYVRSMGTGFAATASFRA
jgi:hypothetical protein